MSAPPFPFPFAGPGVAPPTAKDKSRPEPEEHPKWQRDEAEAFARTRFRDEASAAHQEHGYVSSLKNLTLLRLPRERHEILDALVRSFTPDELPLRVEKTPEVAGGDACIVRTRIPVWTLVSYRRQGLTDEELLASFPTLRKPDLESAWIYARVFPGEIEAAIRENEIEE
jgi:uncharacterized protein (DUF433 family)